MENKLREEAKKKLAKQLKPLQDIVQSYGYVV